MRAAWLALAAAALVAPSLASAQYSMPTTLEDAPNFYPTAYKDQGGQDWACGSIYYSGHNGTDIGVGGFPGMDAGQDIVAAADGTVSYSVDGFFDRCTTGGCPGGGGFGNYVKIDHADGSSTYYGHLRQWSVQVETGDEVTCGQLLGQVGSSGNSTGPHLHFEPRIGSAVDPFSGSCSGPTSLWNAQGSHGGLPEVTCSAAALEPIVVDDLDPEFAWINDTDPGDVDDNGSGYDGHFYYAGPSSLGSVVEAEWRPDIPQTGLYQIEAFVPDSAEASNSFAPFNVAFMGGHAIWPLDMSTNDGDWVPLFPDQPFKFIAGTRNRVTMWNVTTGEGQLAWDALRFTYMGPPGSGGIGDSCGLPNDCAGTLTCYEAICAADCLDVGCASGECEYESGACIDGSPNDPEDWGDWWNPPPDQDTDGDGIPDYIEGNEDTDGDGFLDWLDSDSDDDGVDDSEEGDGDYDHDGIPHYEDEDSDNDGIPDGEEGTDDTDGDGQPDFLDVDSDGDCMGDALEWGESELAWNVDGDGNPDYLDTDSDNDGIPDIVEVGEDCSAPVDSDGDGVPDYQDPDSDGDGVDDDDEGDVDSDGDGVPDYLDEDSDDDGILDGDDEDRDGDGVIDDLEGGDVNPFDAGNAGCCVDQSIDGADQASAGLLLLLLGPLFSLRRRARIG